MSKAGEILALIGATILVGVVIYFTQQPPIPPPPPPPPPTGIKIIGFEVKAR